MSTKYAVGDKVVIASEEILRDCPGFSPSMLKWAGQTVTINNRVKDSPLPYNFEGVRNNDNGFVWNWSDNMIDHKATERLQRKLAFTTVTCPHCGQVIEGIEGIDYIIEDGNVLCKDCIEADEDSKYTFCSDCGAIIEKEDAQTGYHNSEEVTVCDDCWDNYVLCDDCGDFYHEDDTESDRHTCVCHDCYDDNYCRCDGCNSIIRCDDSCCVHTNDGDIYVCDNCLSNYNCCDECDEYFDDESCYRDEEDHCVCDNCFDRYGYRRCENCDTLIRENEINWSDDDYAYCDECYSEHCHRNSIHNYSYKPTPIFFKSDNERSKLFMGVELEVDNGEDAGDTAFSITDTMEFDGDDHVYCKHDGSLNDGIEIVSHPCTLRYHMEQMPWQDVMQIALNNGFTSHNARTCGLHVHVSRNFFGSDETEQDLAIAKLIMLIDKFWDNVTKFSRRGQSELNRWAHKNDIDIKENDLVDEIKEKMNSQKLQGRYHAINLCNYSTIEFRLFRGTLRYETFIATLQFVQTMCLYAKSVSLNDIYSVTWNDIFLNTEFTELRSYMQSRGLLPTATIVEDEESEEV